MKTQEKAQQVNSPTKQQTQEQRMQRQNQQLKQKVQVNKKVWMPLVRFLKKKQLKFKTARCENFRVDYFRVDELESLIAKNKQQIQKNAVLRDLVSRWSLQVVLFNRPQTMPKMKYPKELNEVKQKGKFASFKFDTSQPKTWLFPVILTAVIAGVLFPLWPYMLKYVLFLICLYLLIAIVSVIILRIVVYLLGAVFGVSFWILPNFFADCSILQSFMPFYSVKKWDSGAFSIIGRLLALAIFGYYAYHLYIDSSWVSQTFQTTKTSIIDIHEWGVGKIKGEKNFSQSALTSINLEDIMNQTADSLNEQTLNLDGEIQLQPTQKVQQKVQNDHQTVDGL